MSWERVNELLDAGDEDAAIEEARRLVKEEQARLVKVRQLPSGHPLRAQRGPLAMPENIRTLNRLHDVLEKRKTDPEKKP